MKPRWYKFLMVGQLLVVALLIHLMSFYRSATPESLPDKPLPAYFAESQSGTNWKFFYESNLVLVITKTNDDWIFRFKSKGSK